MRIKKVYSDKILIGLNIFNPDNLPIIKKIAIIGNRAIIINENATQYQKGSNKIIIDGEVYKFCSYCNRFMSLNNFYHRKHASDGIASYCRECSKNRSKLFYYLNRDYYLLKSREQYFRKLEEKGFPKDMRLKENRKPSVPKHWHPWSKYWQVTVE